MAAVLIPFTSSDLFKTGFSSTEVIRIPFLSGLIGSSSLAIYTEVMTSNSETIQYFLTFDDVIRHIHFGKGIGSVVANGLIFSDKSSNISSTVQKLYSAYGSSRGQKIPVSIGGYSCQAVLSSMTCTIMAEPDTMAAFSFNLAIVSDSLGA